MISVFNHVKQKMKTIYILVFGVIVFSCSKDDTPIIATVPATNQVENVPVGALTGKWKLIKYYDITLGTIESEPTDIKRSVIIDFWDNGS